MSQNNLIGSGIDHGRISHKSRPFGQCWLLTTNMDCRSPHIRQGYLHRSVRSQCQTAGSADLLIILKQLKVTALSFSLHISFHSPVDALLLACLPEFPPGSQYSARKRRQRRKHHLVSLMRSYPGTLFEGIDVFHPLNSVKIIHAGHGFG